MRGLSSRLLEGASEMGNRQAALTREVSQRDFAIQATPQNLLGAPHLPGCQTAADQAILGAGRVKVRARMPGGDAEDLGDLFMRGTYPDGGGRVHGDAVVAALGHGDREGDEFLHLRVEQAGYGGSTPEHLVTVYDIDADVAGCRRRRGTFMGVGPLDLILYPIIRC